MYNNAIIRDETEFTGLKDCRVKFCPASIDQKSEAFDISQYRSHMGCSMVDWREMSGIAEDRLLVSVVKNSINIDDLPGKISRKIKQTKRI